MDDYLSKPLEMTKLQAALERWVPLGEAVQVDVSTVGGESEDTSVIDPSALKEMFGDDDETFKEILLDFVEPSLDIVQEIKDGYEARDAQAIGAAGHKLKSSSRAVGANALADLCAELEVVGKGDDWEGIEASLQKLDPLMEQVTNYIKAL